MPNTPPSDTASSLADDAAGGDRRRSRWRAFVPGLAIFLVALLARWHGIAGKPYWMDEVVTLQRAALSWPALIGDSLHFHHLPSYFALIAGIEPFGTHEAWIRLPSALFGAGAAAAVFGIARAIGGLEAGLLAGALMALSPTQVQYGQEARSYAMVICCIAIALRGLVGLALDPRAASRPWRDPGAARGPWITYFGATLAGLNVLSVALFWVAAASIGAIGIARARQADARGFLRNWGMVHAGLALLMAPWFTAMMVAAHGRVGNAVDWVPPISWGHVWSAIASVYLLRVGSLVTFHLFAAPVPGVAIGVAVLAVLGLIWLQRRRPARAVLAAGALGLPLAIGLISLVASLWMPRYLLWGAAPFFVVAGLGIGMVPQRLRRPALALLLVLIGVNLLPYYSSETKPRWDLAAATLRQAGIGPGDMVLTEDPWGVGMTNVYLARTGQALRPEQWTVDPDRAQARLVAGGRVWALYGRVGQGAMTSTLDQFLARIAELGRPASWIAEGRDVVLLRFDHPPPPEIACADGQSTVGGDTADCAPR